MDPHDHIWQQQTVALLRADPLRMAILQQARALQLPDWYLAAGFLRNAIWDAVHQQPMTPLNDVDLVYFEPDNLSTAAEQSAEQQLQQQFPTLQFEVRNQARMHLKHQHSPYASCGDGIRRWVEQPTCVGVRLQPDDELVFFAPFGLGLNWSLQVTVNPDFPRPAVFAQRVTAKRWPQLWPQLQIDNPDSNSG